MSRATNRQIKVEDVEDKLVENLSVSGTYNIDYSFDTWNLVVTGKYKGYNINCNG